MFAFYARAKDIKSWTGVRRVAEMQKGVQRTLVPSRVNAIKRFIASDVQNIIPGSVLIAFNEGTTSITPIAKRIQPCIPEVTVHNGCDDLMSPSVLEFNFDETVDEHLRPALIVDGQHRLSGLSAYESEDIPILVVALIDASPMEQAFQFVVINNKSVRVPTNDVKSIIADIDVDTLQERLLSAGIRYGDKSPTLRDVNNLEASPFKDLLDWAYNTRQGGRPLISLTAIEQSLRYINLLFENALSGGYNEGDDDSLLQIFMAMWRMVKAKYNDIWLRNNKLTSKVAIVALNELLSDKLKSAWEFNLVDIYETSEIETFISRILSPINVEFWESEWTVSIQDNANVRKMIKHDLVAMMENNKLGRTWSIDLHLVATHDHSS
jgi:DGQHR domain-containing protein